MARLGLCTRSQRPRSSFTSTVNRRPSDTCCTRRSIWRAACDTTTCTRSQGATVQALGNGDVRGDPNAIARSLRKSFDGHYGWASHILKPGRTNLYAHFTDIEEVVLLICARTTSWLVTTFTRRPRYRSPPRAHGRPRDSVVGGEQLRAGRSGAEPTFVSSSSYDCLGLLHPTFDTTMMMKVVNRLQKDVADAFGSAHRQLLSDERNVRSARRSRATRSLTRSTERSRQ